MVLFQRIHNPPFKLNEQLINTNSVHKLLLVTYNLWRDVTDAVAMQGLYYMYICKPHLWGKKKRWPCTSIYKSLGISTTNIRLFSSNNSYFISIMCRIKIPLTFQNYRYALTVCVVCCIVIYLPTLDSQQTTGSEFCLYSFHS